MRISHFPAFADILRADPTTLARELHSVTAAAEHEFSSDRARDAYADLLRALGAFMHASAFERALAEIAGETFRPLPTRAICSRCGSDDVVRDAAARWNENAGAWVLACVHDDHRCQGCGAEGADMVDFLPVAPEVGARVRIMKREHMADDPHAGRTGEVTRFNRLAAGEVWGCYVHLDPRSGERDGKIELVALPCLELLAPAQS